MGTTSQSAEVSRFSACRVASLRIFVPRWRATLRPASRSLFSPLERVIADVACPRLPLGLQLRLGDAASPETSVCTGARSSLADARAHLGR
eukprot:scaffold117869_cov63-Phaeocystis_antarctica.AAC.3